MERNKLSDARAGALAVTAFTFLITLIAFCSPYWLASDRRLYGQEFDKLGLWVTCFRSLRGPQDLEYTKYYSGCRWIFFYEYKNIRGFLLPGWFSFILNSFRLDSYKIDIITFKNNNQIKLN